MADANIASSMMFLPHEADHIIAEQHGGPTTLENLAWSCALCNRNKGTNIASIDRLHDAVAPLFNPRKRQWQRHFRLNGPRIEPLTASGRATELLLQLNVQRRLDHRLGLLAEGVYPRH